MDCSSRKKESAWCSKSRNIKDGGVLFKGQVRKSWRKVIRNQDMLVSYKKSSSFCKHGKWALKQIW